MPRRRFAIIIAAIAGVAVVIALVITRPWLALVDVTVDDAIPSAAPAGPSGETMGEPGDAAPDEPGDEAGEEQVDGPVVVATGAFISHEHETTGAVSVIERADGSRVLAIEGLSTTTGPDVHVWLSDSDVVAGFDGWFVAGGAPFIDLGPIKGNLGDQVYEIPEGVDLARFRSVTLWCVEFSVSFGAATLA